MNLFKKIAQGAIVFAFSGSVFAGCFDGITQTTSVNSKIRGFYVTNSEAGEDTAHYVIVDGATCSADTSGNAVVGSTTKSHFYLRFRSKDKELYAALLSAQARDVTVKFRLKPTSVDTNYNDIAYIVSPYNAHVQ